jgi:putative ABC transport system substrate-binding protein
LLAAFKEEMAKFGWKEGVGIIVDERWADGRVENLPRLSEDLAAKKPALVVSCVPGATRRMAKLLPNTPIVQATGTSPVEMGLAASLAKPGGMVTGVTNLAQDLAVKRLELLLDAMPTLKRVGYLLDGSISTKGPMDTARRSIERYRVEAHFAEAATPDDIAAAVARLAKAQVQAIIAMPGFFLYSERARVIAAAQAQRLPVVTGHAEFAETGALITYGANDLALTRRAAYFVDRILRGAKPGDLPIEQPATLEFIVNLRTARALGLNLPRELLVRADKVIE